MPALNEEENVSPPFWMPSDLLSGWVVGEIIVVNDGSTDKTEDVIRG